jgi:hypothetical protein
MGTVGDVRFSAANVAESRSLRRSRQVNRKLMCAALIGTAGLVLLGPIPALAQEAVRNAKTEAEKATQPNAKLLDNVNQRHAHQRKLIGLLDPVIDHLDRIPVTPTDPPRPWGPCSGSDRIQYELVPVCVTKCEYGPFGRRIVRTWTETEYIYRQLPWEPAKDSGQYSTMTVRGKIREELLKIMLELADVNLDRNQVTIRNREVLGLLALIERLRL